MTAAPAPSELTASGLAYLFPEKFPAPAALGTSVVAPESTVVAETPAINLIVIALWSLRESGFIELHPFTEKHLKLFTSHGVRAVVKQTPETAGIEGRLLHALGREKHDGADVKWAVQEIVPAAKDPYAAAVTAVEDEVATAGYLTKVHRRPGLMAIFDGEPKWTYQPIPELYPPLAGRADALAKAWNSFLADPTYPAVCDVVREAIASRTVKDVDPYELQRQQQQFLQQQQQQF